VKRLSSPQPQTAAKQEFRRRRREEILEKVVRLFAQHGYAAADTQFLADELQIGKGTLYRYFPTKEALFLAAVDYGMSQLHAQVMAYAAGAADPLDRVRQGVRGYLSFFAEHPENVELLIQERAMFKDQRLPVYYQRRQRASAWWREVYGQLIDAGHIREIPPERISNVIGDLLYGTMFTNYFAEQPRSFEDQANEILDIVFHGILSDSERQNRRDTKTGPK
jgi:AcrR family transcriptional regulator